MKRSIINVLIKILCWLDPAVYIISLEQDVMDFAIGQVELYAEERFDGQSAEYKRAQAYGALLKRFPNVKPRKLSQAIEYAVEHVL